MAERRYKKKAPRALAAHASLVHAAESLDVYLGRQLEGFGLTIGQYHVLEALILDGPMSPAALSVRLRCSDTNVKFVTENLQKRGLAVRRSGDKNSRSVTIHLTPEGRNLIAQVAPLRAKLIRAQMRALKGREQETLQRLCDKLAEGDARKFVLEMMAVDEDEEDES